MIPTSEETTHSSSSDGMGSNTPVSPMPQTQADKMSWSETWEDSKGMLLVLTSESFGSGMAATTKLLASGHGEGMSVLQIVFVRFGITLTLSTLYMWLTNVPDFPFGKREVRWVLVLRGCGGLVGVYGFYYSLQYLPVAEALFLSFITPLFTAYACSLLLHEPFIKKQLYAALISLFGILLIAHPTSLFGSTSPSSSRSFIPDSPEVTPLHRLSAIFAGLISVLGATCAYTTIRVIGPRAHPLISVNYYALMSTLVSGILLSLPFYPETFRLPHGTREWTLLLGLGIFGFFLQFLMTAGLVRDRSSRATNMMYSSILFGLLLDWAIWGVVPGAWSAVGGSIVVAATVWGALQKKDGGGGGGGRRSDEEYAMVPGGDVTFLLEGEDGSSDDETVHDDDGTKGKRESFEI